MDNYKTYLSSALTVALVVGLILLKNLPPALGYDEWISQETYDTLLTLILTGGGAATLAALRHGVAKGQR